MSAAVVMVVFTALVALYAAVRSLLPRWLADWIIRRARKPHPEGHIYHDDGSLYMGRWMLFETRWISARVHYIASPDRDRHAHDHPWPFLTLVLSGGYMEARPKTIEPCFIDGQDRERFVVRPRSAGSIAFRHPTDRHIIVSVQPQTWTLFIYGPKRQWWGFYTPGGKVHWRDYTSKHLSKEAA